MPSVILIRPTVWPQCTNVIQTGQDRQRTDSIERTVFSERELRSLYAIARPSVVCLSVICNVRAPYSGGSDFRPYFYGIRCLGHSWTSTENFMEIVSGELLRLVSLRQER